MVLYLLILLGIAGWRFLPRPWHPAITVKTPNYLVFSTATPEQTARTARALELLYAAYSNKFGAMPQFQRDHPLLKVKLFKDRKEFRWVNPGMGWAEAYYREPYCNAYFSDAEINPYHWMLHECVHQLNREVSHFKLEKWLDEGLAEYFSTSRLTPNALTVGKIDPNTYPVWWIDDLATAPTLEENLRNGSVIPLRAIVSGHGGPSMSSQFNLYYLHWWTLTYFIFETEPYRQHALELAERGGDLDAFEQLIGPVDKIQVEWHSYVRALKLKLSGRDKQRAKPKPAAPTPTS